MPGFPAAPQQMQSPSAPNQFIPPVNVGGIMRIQSAGAILDAARRTNDAALAAQQALPEVIGLSGYLDRCWEQARVAKQEPERLMLNALRARRGEYNPDQIAQLKQQGGSAIFMMIMSTKARGAKALISDVTIGIGGEKGWTLSPTPVAELPEDVQTGIIEGVAQEVMLSEQINGPVLPEVIAQRLHELKDEVLNKLQQEAIKRTARMESKMEDQLIEGGYLQAMSEFVDDFTTYKTAFVQGPIIRKRPKLVWTKQADGSSVAVVQQILTKFWKRVDPLTIYPAPWASNVNDAWLFQKHKLARGGLFAMIGAPGYSEVAIRQVLDLYGTSGLRKDWMWAEQEKAQIEGKDQASVTQADTIDALQFHGPISGKMLLEWGIDPAKCPDAAREYECEVWKIGPYIIKAALNEDPLGRRGYYADSYESIPGAFWGNSLYDLIRDCIDMCNSAARSLANNLGISSGPQVGINVDRLPAGEQVTAMYPWKIWQFTSDPMGNTTQPAMQFFQPQSNAQELMLVYEKFSTLADEYSGVPRYMTGTDSAPGAGRTASGLSMMIGNASKLIKDVVAGIDLNITIPLLEMLYYFNMRYETDPDLKGDVQIKARGALALVQKETAAQNRANFLMNTNNPVDLQIMGAEGRSYVLHEQAKSLDLDPDKVVPTPEMQRRKAAIAAVIAATQAGAGTSSAAQPPTPATSGQALTNGAPVTDNFTPQPNAASMG